LTVDSSLESLLPRLDADDVKLGDIKKIAAEIKRDHELAMALWATERLHPRLLAVLILDKKLLTQDVIDGLVADLEANETDDRLKIAEWLLANQLMKSKPTTRLVESWREADSPLLRHLFWYHQGRLRWVGQDPPANTTALLEALETDMEAAEPEVQWAMNFTAANIGIHDSQHRTRCVELGERLGLYKDDPVPPNCTPDYLPDYIRIEVEKLPS